MASKKKKIKVKVTKDYLAKKYEGAGLVVDVTPHEDDLLWVPSTSPVMNYQMGGGVAYGRVVEFAGEESSGKTLLALNFISVAQELGGVGIMVDAELAFSRPWAALNGVDIETLFLYPENVIELIADFVAEISIYYRSTLINNEPIVLVIDSVAALDTKLAMETAESDSKAEMGARAKAFYKLLRIRNRLWNRLGVSVIFINQLRDKINTGFGAKFQEKETTVGGNALKFFASIRVWLYAKKQLTVGSGDRKRRKGIEVEVKMKKNKLAMPRVSRRMSVIFDPNEGDVGWSLYGGLADILIREGAVTKSGGAYIYEDEEIAKSLSAFEELLEEDDELREEILFSANIMTIEQMQTRLDEEDENRYPISGVTFEAFTDAKDEKEDNEE